MKIVVLDGAIANPGDLSWSKFDQLGQVTVYDQTQPAQLIHRAKEADIIVTNKVVIGARDVEMLSELKCICLLATGYDNIDTKATAEKGIVVCNAVGYSSESVAQHVFALMLHFTNAVHQHNMSIQSGEWFDNSWSYSLKSLVELNDKVLGIIGFGRIGQAVARIGQSFGMPILSSHKHPQRDAMEGVKFVELDTLCSRSDFITLHTPLNDDNVQMVDASFLNRMKNTAILINTGRGGLINEPDLRDALISGCIAGAGLDVLSTEPPSEDHPLIGLDNCVLTPHHAWATRESRQRLLDIVYDNLVAFMQGNPVNLVK